MSSSSKRQRVEDESALASLDKYREIGSKARKGASNDKLNSPYSVCADADLVYVADYGNHRVQAFDKRSLGYVKTFGTGVAGAGDNQLNHPISIALDDTWDTPRKGYLYVSDFLNGRVQVLDKKSGALVKSIGAGILGKQSQGVCLNRARRELIVADTSNNRIQIFHCYTGELLRTYRDVNNPSSVAFFEDLNELYVSDWENERVIILDSETGIEKSSHCLKTSETVHPYGIIVDRVTRHVFVACSSAGTVRRFCSSKSDHCFKSLESVFETSTLHSPREMFLDEQTGCMFIADKGSHFVCVDRSYLDASTSKSRVDYPIVVALERMVNTPDFADLHLTLDDRSRLPAHKLVLYARSPVFRRILSEKPANKRDEFGIFIDDLLYDKLYVDSRDGSHEVLVRGIAKAPMQEFLRYLYTDKFSDPETLDDRATEVTLSQTSSLPTLKERPSSL